MSGYLSRVEYFESKMWIEYEGFTETSNTATVTIRYQ